MLFVIFIWKWLYEDVNEWYDGGVLLWVNWVIKTNDKQLTYVFIDNVKPRRDEETNRNNIDRKQYLVWQT